MIIQFIDDTSLQITNINTPPELIRVYMTLKNITAAQLAKVTGISNIYLNLILKGAQAITRNTSERIGKALKINPLVLYRLQLKLKIEALQIELKQCI